MKERILYVIAFVILASCFAAGACIIFDVLHAMDCDPNVQGVPAAAGDTE